MLRYFTPLIFILTLCAAHGRQIDTAFYQANQKAERLFISGSNLYFITTYKDSIRIDSQRGPTYAYTVANLSCKAERPGQL